MLIWSNCFLNSVAEIWSNRYAVREVEYVLAKDAGDITIADIVFAVDEPLDVTRCGGSGNCAKGSIKCVTHNLWASLNERIIDYLESVTLSDLSGKETGTARDKQNSGKIALYAKPAKQKDMTA